MSDLLSGSTAQSYADHTIAVIRTLAERFRTTTVPFSGADRQHLQRLVETINLDAPGTGIANALIEIDELFVANAVWFHHPAYQSHLNCPVALPAVATEAILAAVNPSVDTYDQSPMGILMERKLVDWTAGRIGFDVETRDGVFTSGGTQSNLNALLLAREWAAARASGTRDPTIPAGRVGTASPPSSRSALAERMVVLTTEHSHFSIEKATRVLGLGPHSVVVVPVAGRGTMDPTGLANTLDAVVRHGRLPMAVAATAGTTDTGCIDPLAEIGAICERAGVWLHVDAAYGGGLLVSPTRRPLLHGIELARSVTIDYHKTFFQPVSSSALIVRDRHDFDPVAWHADYLNPVEDDAPNQVHKSLQTTRRFDALKLWATVRAMGADGIGSMVDRVIDLAAAVHTRMHSDPDFEVLAETDLSTVLFRYAPDGLDGATADRLVPAVRQRLFELGRAIVAKTVFDGRPCLKLTLLNPETTLTDVCRVLDLVRLTAQAHVDGDRRIASVAATCVEHGGSRADD